MVQSKKKLLNQHISNKIKQIRQEKGVTLEVFYFDTGVHLARIEQGKTNITVFTLKKVCDYFEITLSSFFAQLENEQD